MVLTPIAAYNVDILHGRSAEVFAVTRFVTWLSCLCGRSVFTYDGDGCDSALRHCITALATASFLPLINSFGVLATDGIAAGVAWTSFL